MARSILGLELLILDLIHRMWPADTGGPPEEQRQKQRPRIKPASGVAAIEPKGRHDTYALSKQVFIPAYEWKQRK
jgi:hypothetical protein